MTKKIPILFEIHRNSEKLNCLIPAKHINYILNNMYQSSICIYTNDIYSPIYSNVGMADENNGRLFIVDRISNIFAKYYYFSEEVKQSINNIHKKAIFISVYSSKFTLFYKENYLSLITKELFEKDMTNFLINHFPNNQVSGFFKGTLDLENRFINLEEHLISTVNVFDKKTYMTKIKTLTNYEYTIDL